MRWPMSLAVLGAALTAGPRRLAPRLVWLPLLLVALAGGCIYPPSLQNSRWTGGDQTGSIYLATPLSALEGGTFSGAKLRLTQGNLTRELLLEVTDGEVTGHVDNLPVGDWNVTLDIYDQDGDVTHRASAVVRIRPDETTTLRLQAEPNDGMLEIEADISGFSEAHEVQRARINFHNNQTATLYPDELDPMLFRGTKALRPGDYDYQIELYGATQYAQDRLYRSPWESVRIYPGKTVKVRWQARSGAAHIEMGLSQMPPPPSELRLETTETGGRLTWLPAADPSVSGYRIYLKHDEFGAFSLVDEVPASERAWETTAKDVKDGAWAAVTAVTSDGRESFRSNVIYIAGGKG